MSNIISTDSCFSEAQKQTLASLADLMIPESGEMPSAADPDILPRTLAGLAAHEAVVVEALAVLDELAAKAHQQSFSALGDADRHALADQLKGLQPGFIAVLQANVVSSYYQDDRALSGLGLPTRSPHPGGHDVAATDWSLLDPVREREPFYRPVADNKGGHDV